MKMIARKRFSFIGTFALFPLFWAAPAQAQFGGGVVVCTNCSDIADQGLQYAQELSTAISAANSYAQQIQMYENMVTQGAALPSQIFGPIASDLSGLKQLVATGTNIAYSASNIDSQFATQFPNYTSFLSQPQTAAQVQVNLKNWTQEMDDSARTSLDAAQLQSSQFDAENSTMSTIQGHSSSAVGEMQAIQAGNEAAVQIVQQLQKLRQLVMTMIDMQAESLAAASRQQAAAGASQQTMTVLPSAITDDSGPDHIGPNFTSTN